MTIFYILVGCVNLNKVIGLDPYQFPDTPQRRLYEYVGIARANEVNILIEESLPSWKVYLLKKNNRFFNKIFGIFTMFKPITMLESDVLRERLILCKGSKDNPKIIAERVFIIQDKRKLENY